MSNWQITFTDARDAYDAYKDLKRQPEYTILLNNKTLDVSLTMSTSTAEEIQDVAQRYGRLESLVDLTPTTYQIEPYAANIFLNFYKNGLYTDQTLLVGEQSFEVHRVILAAASMYFKDLLEEFEQPVLEIPNVKPNLFADLLDLIYGVKMPFAGLQTVRLMILVDYFGVREVNTINIISQVQIDHADLPEYNKLLKQLYPTRVPQILIKH